MKAIHCPLLTACVLDQVGNLGLPLGIDHSGVLDQSGEMGAGAGIAGDWRKMHILP